MGRGKREAFSLFPSSHSRLLFFFFWLFLLGYLAGISRRRESHYPDFPRCYLSKWSMQELFANICTLKPHFTDTRLIGHIIMADCLLCPWEKKPVTYIFSKFNPLNTDTPIIQKHSMAPSVSILTAEFDNIYSCHDAWPQVNQSFPNHLMLVACYEILITILLYCNSKTFQQTEQSSLSCLKCVLLFLFSCVTFFRFLCDVNKKKLALCHMLPYWSTVSHL